MEIAKIPNKILSKKTEPVDIQKIKDGSYNDLILNMKKVMIEHNGIGLAANQVNKDLSIFVIEENLAKENDAPTAYFNPKITEYSKDMGETEEGCLSIPEYYKQIQRSKKIKIKFINEKGKKQKIKARGMLARVLQHETDHLNGITIRDL
jgi:peptide deformylase